MTRYRRRGHIRVSKNGTRHWVSPHSVNRSDSYRSSAARRRTSYRPVQTYTPPTPPAVKWRRLPGKPNATCPVCGAPVWFFRNEYGGCAYFDALGRPWPLHPCMNGRVDRHAQRAVEEAKAAYERARARAERKAAAQRRRAARARAREAARTERAEKKTAARRAKYDEAAQRLAARTQRREAEQSETEVTPGSRKQASNLQSGRAQQRRAARAAARASMPRRLKPGERPALMLGPAEVAEVPASAPAKEPGVVSLLVVMLLVLLVVALAWVSTR